MWLDWQECDGVMIKDDYDKLDEIQEAKHFKFQLKKNYMADGRGIRLKGLQFTKLLQKKVLKMGDTMMNQNISYIWILKSNVFKIHSFQHNIQYIQSFLMHWPFTVQAIYAKFKTNNNLNKTTAHVNIFTMQVESVMYLLCD